MGRLVCQLSVCSEGELGLCMNVWVSVGRGAAGTLLIHLTEFPYSTVVCECAFTHVSRPVHDNMRLIIEGDACLRRNTEYAPSLASPLFRLRPGGILSTE